MHEDSGRRRRRARADPARARAGKPERQRAGKPERQRARKAERQRAGTRDVLGIDVGGGSIKAAIVRLPDGELLDEPLEIETPRSRRPTPMIRAIAQVVARLKWRGRVGCGFPAVVQDGVVRTASHIDRHWLGFPLRQRLARHLLLPLEVINDADAAGLAEMRYGAGKGRNGLVLMITLGTGIGTAVFHRGRLVPHLEIGRIRVGGRRGHELCSNRAREQRGLSWKSWAKSLDRFLEEVRLMLFPDLVIIGGGVSARADRFLPRLTVDVEVVPAAQLNQAGIVGAALAGAGDLDAAPALE